MPVENTTANRGYQLPDASNDIADDVYRLIAGLEAIDIDVAGLLASLAGKAAAIHTHVIADTTGLQSALDAKEAVANKGVANGYASLDGTGKVPSAQLPAAVFGALAYQGVWNANTNTPTIPAASSANKGYYYKVTTAGTTTIDGESDWKAGDWIVSNGTSWDKADHTDQVMSVAGLVGTISAAALKAALAIAIADVSGLQAALDAKAPVTRTVGVAGLATGGGDLSADRTITVPKASQAQAEAGADDASAMTPLKTKQAIDALAEGGGLTLLGTLTTTSGSSQSFTGIPAGYKALKCVLRNISGTSTGSLRVALSSNNGASYGSSDNVGPNQASGASFGGICEIWGVSEVGKPKTVIGVMGNVYCNGWVEETVTGAIDAIRFTFSLGSFDAGAIDIYGVK